MNLTDIDLSVWRRFWQKIDQNQDCWLWTGSKDRKGYGFFRLKNKMVKPHRVSYLIYHGKEPSNQCCHRCDNPACVNPKHLWDGTPKQNVQDAVKKGRFSTTRNRGTANRGCKITPNDVRTIRSLAHVGISTRELAKKFNLSKSQVYRILNSQRWKDVKSA